MLGEEDLRRALAAVAFDDAQAAARSLTRLQALPQAAELVAGQLPALLRALQQSPSPDRALLGLERLLEHPRESRFVADSLAAQPDLLRPLLAVIGSSPLLAETLVREPALMRWLADLPALTRLRSRSELAAELEGLLSEAPLEERPDIVRAWQQRELWRIGGADLLGLLDHKAVTSQLSRLADVVIQQALTIAMARTQRPDAKLVVLALGKLGGEELNYSSDIDLLFLVRRDAGDSVPVAEALIDILSARSARGWLYRVDMRLRPWGSAGPLVITAEAYGDYVRRHARLWERQALLKARPVAGDVPLGHAVLRDLSELIFGVPPERARAEAREAKRRIEDQLSRRGRGWGEVKLGIGSLRDIEFVTQTLQLVHGGRLPSLRTPNTLEALNRLASAGVLPPDDHRVLSEGYRFLRPLEHYLQLLHGRQTHTLPKAPAELAFLGRRLGFGGQDPGATLTARYAEHIAAIRAVYERYLGEGAPASAPGSRADDEIAHHVRRMDASYAETFTPDELRHHAELADGLAPDKLIQVDVQPLAGDDWRVTIIGYDYPGELAIICGLLTAYGCDIREGSVFTYERGAPEAGTDDTGAGRRKIVDVLTVRRPLGRDAAPWAAYAEDLARLVRLLATNGPAAAQAELARLVARSVGDRGATERLHPVFLELDNTLSDRYTVLHIDAVDTPGFLYEFASALAVLGYSIERMTVASRGNRVVDTLYLTDRHGRQVTAPEQQRALRVATALVQHFTHLLPHAPDPGRAITHFQDLIAQLLSRPDWPSQLASLDQPAVLEGLARLLGVSDFMWNELLRIQHENLFPIIRDVEALAEPKPIERLRAELAAELAQAGEQPEARIAALNAFKDREIFRTDLRHIQGYLASFAAFAEELSDVAEVVIEGAYDLCRRTLLARHGEPRLPTGDPAPMVVLALGKLGGREIGYASDIELLFVYAGEGQTTGPEAVANSLFYEELVRRFLQSVRARRAGIFEVDLRLRPYGEAGSLAVSLEAFRRYFSPSGPAWPYERQALVRLRPIAGDADLGRQVVELRDECVYHGAPVDVRAIRAMRERQLRHLVAGGTLNAKFSRGGLVDVEYLVQALQMRHGSTYPAVRSPNTQAAMAALADIGVLSADDHSRLREAHLFLRRVIDALRMVRGNARDLTVPSPESDEFVFLARRCGYGQDAHALRRDLVSHMDAVQELVERLLR